ncbi:hypothetical protein HID58_065591 [Brassica napus]|uniref:PH domain-containing protein n=1 Tax=Brassica napus TaxID=3708 RepID=A0ABQ7ZDP9_BRANA|nr:hypothetical protein HID58_065591 [Brassica napus]
MSKRSASSVPLSADESRSRRRVGSPASQSRSSSDTDVTPDCDLTAPLPLTYTSPLSLGPASKVTADDLVEWRDSGLTIVEELPRSERKGLVFNKRWAERYAFMSLHGSTYQWNIVAGTHPAPPEGENFVLQAWRLPLDRRQVNILVGETVLRCSSLWSKHIFCGFSFSFSASNRSLCAGNMSGSAADESFAAYQEAAKVMSAKKGSAKPEGPPKNLCRPLRMVSSKTLQSCTCSQELALAEPSFPTSYKQDHQELHQISASELTSNQVGHENFKETPSEATSGESRAEGASQTQDGDTQPGRRPLSLVALVDECDYTFHGSAGNLHQRETVVPEHQQRGEPQGLGHETSLNRGP